MYIRFTREDDHFFIFFRNFAENLTFSEMVKRYYVPPKMVCQEMMSHGHLLDNWSENTGETPGQTDDSDDDETWGNEARSYKVDFNVWKEEW